MTINGFSTFRENMGENVRSPVQSSSKRAQLVAEFSAILFET